MRLMKVVRTNNLSMFSYTSMLSADWEIVSVPMAKSAAKQVSVTPPKFTSPSDSNGNFNCVGGIQTEKSTDIQWGREKIMPRGGRRVQLQNPEYMVCCCDDHRYSRTWLIQVKVN
jgi:hypothetical protein